LCFTSCCGNIGLQAIGRCKLLIYHSLQPLCCYVWQFAVQLKRAKEMATTPTSPKREERLDARVTREEKQLIESAANLRGTSSSDFVRMAIREAALKTIREYESLTLAENSRKVFVEALLNPPQPNEKARAAAQRYKRRFA
jgi:uncharacterized protein (DUF1778 family)